MEDGDDLRFDHGDETPDRLKAQLSRLVGLTAAQTHRAAGKALRAVDAHKDHFVVLAALAEFGPASQSALAGRARIYKSDLVSVLNELADGGWIRRTPDPTDKRRNVITITSAGERRLAALDRILEDVNNHVMAPLTSAERAQLFNLLTRINTHLSTPDDQPTVES
jgi:DNA-binding MarR family transcriptional regulator